MKRKWSSLILVLAMLGSLFVPALAAEAVPAYVLPDVAGKVVILHTNDVHGADVAKAGSSIGMAGVSQLKKDFEAAGAKVLLLSAGDSIMGKPLVSADKGKSAIGFMNAAGYDAMAVGNHELDFGLENLKELAKAAQFPILCANMTQESSQKTIFDSNKLFDLNGVKIGVFGLATPETLTKADASKMPGITFPQGEALYKVAQAQVDELKKAGAELVVCIGHLGVADESVGNRSIDVCKNVKGIDLFVDGHSHSSTDEIAMSVEKAGAGSGNIVNGTKIVSTGTALANVGLVMYDTKTKTLTDSLISAAAYSKVDQTVAKLVNDQDKAVNDQYGAPIATTEVDLNGSRSGGAATSTNSAVSVVFPANQGVRTAETNLGDFAADAILWQARKTLGADKVDASITNGGGIRETLAKGNVSKLDLLSVFPFGNTVSTISVTGAELLEALEAATYTTPDAIGAFPQVAGLVFLVNSAVPYENAEQYPGSTYYAPADPGSRVTIVSVNGKAFDAKATYTIATNDFTAKGGDTYGVFKRVGGWKDIGVALEDALINYTTEELNGVITAEKYGSSGERIYIVPTDVVPGSWYAEATYYNILIGAMSGTGKGFEPDTQLTRGQLLQIIYNMEDKPGVGAGTVAFGDITGKWYENAVRWAASVDIVDGRGATFGGDELVTRAETAHVIAKYAVAGNLMVDEGGMAMKEAPDYDKIPAEYLEGMSFCYYAGIMTGNSAGELLPDALLTRAQMAQIIYNFTQAVSQASPIAA